MSFSLSTIRSTLSLTRNSAGFSFYCNQICKFSTTNNLAADTATGGENRRYKNYRHNKEKISRKLGIFGSIGFLMGGSALWTFRKAKAQESPEPESYLTPPDRPDLPIFSKKTVSEHNCQNSGIWVVYQHGVYDISDFVAGHPGGDKILLASGGSVEPFWAMYALHKTPETMEMLEELRIGNLDPDESFEPVRGETADPFASEPVRHPALQPHALKPYNAEVPPDLIVDSFVTPNELFFVRNHLPVPKQAEDLSTHSLIVGGMNGISKEFSIEDLKTKFEPVTITSAIQCAGNRRSEMDQVRQVKGLQWGFTAISNAAWTGVRLRDLLIAAGVNPKKNPDMEHVQFEGADTDPTGQTYGASIPVEKAMKKECIVAYEMNGKPLPLDHGFPLRVIVPGTTHMEVKGYAYSGGGRGIIRVDVSSDGGRTWYPATLEQAPEQSWHRMWAWTLWHCRVPIPADAPRGSKLEITAKATNFAYNTQPEHPDAVWNFRGLLNNSWHRIEVIIS